MADKRIKKVTSNANIGDVVMIDGIAGMCLTDIDGDLCCDCAFKGRRICHRIACVSSDRNDGDGVYFKPINVLICESE